jgi:predicted nucleic acid-binding protein
MTASNSSAAFVDTNVLIYSVSPADDRHGFAVRLVRELISTGALRISTQILQEFFHVSTRKMLAKLTMKQALDHMENWARFPVVLIDYPAIREAAQISADRQLSFWDALIVVAAKRCDAKRLYTEDLNHGQIIEGVEVVNPFR